MHRVHLDYETYSPVGIDRGVFQYAQKAEILLAALYDADGNLLLQYDHFYPGSTTLVELKEYLFDPDYEIHAFNVGFEREITRQCLGIEIPDIRLRCTMAFAYSRGFTGTLRNVGEQIGLPEDLLKQPQGKALIARFCSPKTPSKAHPWDRWIPEDDPEKWEQFREYNRQDVIAEREIYRRLAEYAETDYERQVWLWDQKVNRRGLPIDQPYIEAALAYDQRTRTRLLARLKEITGLDNPNSRNQLLGWLNTPEHRGNLRELPDLTKGTIEWALAHELSSQLQEALQLRRELAKTSVKKYAAAGRIGAQGVARDTLQYCGAGRTGRFSGRTIQPQNMKRPSIDGLEATQELLAERNFELLDIIHDQPLEVLASCTRGLIAAPEGCLLVVADESAIESRVLGWLAKCQRINETFAAQRDTYKVFAEDWLGVPYDEVTKYQRFLAKPATLGCGYRLGVGGLIKYGETMGVELDEEQAESAVKTFRSVYREVPQLWYWLERIVGEVMVTGQPQAGYRLVIRREPHFLTIELPSTRKLYYLFPRWQQKELPWGELAWGLTYMGKNQYTQQWDRLDTHGGKLTENIVQAIARDILVEGCLLAERRGLEIRGHVHDEAILVSFQDQAEMDLTLLNACLSTTPNWAPGLLLASEGYYAKRYRKE